MMKDISKLLVPNDGSKNALRGLELAITLAKQTNASITSVYSNVIESHSSFRSSQINENSDELSKKIMDTANKIASKHNVDFNYEIMNGDPSYNIIKYANEKKMDMIIMGSRGRSNLKNMLFGSVTNSVLQSSKIPILVVK